MSVRPKGGLKAQAQRNEVKQDAPETRGQANGAARGTVCKWLSDDFNAVCTNADCDCVADFCPCVNWPQICRHSEEADGPDVDSAKRTSSVSASADTFPRGEGLEGADDG